MSELRFRVRELHVQQEGQAEHKTIKGQMSLQGVRGLPRGCKGHGALKTSQHMRLMLPCSTFSVSGNCLPFL